MSFTPKSRPPSAPPLFAEPERSAGVYVANVDGASRGNPGPASYAVVLRAPDGATKFEIGKYLGRATNNVAEYYGLITALDYAAANGIDRLLVRSDSELLVRQMQGRYKVKSPDLRPLYERARKLTHALAHFAIEHVPRERNAEADELANQALDRTSTPAGRGEVKESSPEKSASPRLSGESAKSEAAAAAAPRREPRGAAAAGQRIRARYSAGALHPLAALDLAEGEIVELTVHTKPDRA